MARLEYELAIYDSTVYRFNYYTTRTSHMKIGYSIRDSFFVREEADSSRDFKKFTIPPYV